MNEHHQERKFMEYISQMKNGFHGGRQEREQENGELPDFGTDNEFIRFMEEMPGGFLIYRAEEGEEIIYANKGLLRIFQCDTMEEFREFTGNSFRGIVYQEDLEEVEESIRTQILSSRYDLDYVEYRIRRKDGSIGWIEDYGHFVRNEAAGNIFYAFLGDATEKRKRLETLRMVRETQEKADLAIAAKNAFLANISHDMRTPLNAIFGFTSLAKLSIHDPDTALEYLEQIETASKKLLDMIEKVLQISALSNAAGPKEEECSFCNILRDAYEFLLPQAREKNIAFSLNDSDIRHSTIYADQENLRQLILNLANNALTYTKPGGTVKISVTEGNELPHQEAVYSLTVEDNGIGISPEFIHQVFEPFAREKNSTLSGIHSIGLGLTIVKHIVDMMGGSIDVQSEVGKGTVFTVNLRFRVQPLSGEAGGASELQRIPQRLLLVEDNELNRDIETELLEKMGFVVDTAENGKTALEKMEQASPGDYDLIIMDIQMPVMDGWQASAAIRRLPNPALSKIPIIALSANVFERDQMKSKESGIDIHLTKPMNFSELLEHIERLTKG